MKAFISILALTCPKDQIWGFGAGAAEDPPVPSDDELRHLLATIGFERLEIRTDPPAVRKTLPGLDVDLDGIAPGWAVDRIAERFETLGIEDYLVELGGEVRARGRNAAGRPWRVAIEAPLAGERRPYAVVELDGVGVSRRRATTAISARSTGAACRIRSTRARRGRSDTTSPP